jgi:hypothetical protein
MCIELHTRYRRCARTRLLHWTYCLILTPSQRQPSTGRACRRHKLRYKESNDNVGCFECKLSEIAGWGAVSRSPTSSNLSETSPTVASFLDYGCRSPTFPAFVGRSPTFPILEKSPTVSTFATSAGLLSIGTGERESKDSETSVAASDKPLSPELGDWRSGDRKETSGKELVEGAKGGGVKGWFKKRFKAREGYDGATLGFQTMDA